MGKGKKGKKADPEKKAALQAKKEAKQEKAARKRIAKQQNLDGKGSDGEGDDDIDAVLQAYRRQDKEKEAFSTIDATIGTANVGKTQLVELETEFPLPRANATLEYVQNDRKDYFYLFGGEYFDGVENIVLDDLLRFEVSKKEWKAIHTPPPTTATATATTGGPPPRCAHSCVSYKQSLYIFGGEMATADQYHHYRDLWKFDTSSMTWQEIAAKSPPSARSGHATIVWKSFMIIFGGFYEALRETKWYNDVHIFSLQSETWLDLPQSRLAAKPEPRSACNVALFGNDKIIIHGGFSKLKATTNNTETKVHTDAWVLHLAPILQNKPPTWERWMSSNKAKSNYTPNGRSGTSSISYKSRMLVFGGVVDSEQLHHKVDSIFYNDLFAMDIERRKWFKLQAKGVNDGSTKRRRRNKGDDNQDKDGNQQEETQKQNDNETNNQSNKNDPSDDDEEESLGEEANEDDVNPENGWNIEKLRANMFAFIDGNGNIVYEKILPDDNEEETRNQERDDDGEEKEESKGDDEDDEEEETKQEKEKSKAGDDDDDEEEETKQSEENVSDTKIMKSSNNADKPKNDKSNSMKITSSSVMTVNADTNSPEAVNRAEPLPRINSSLVLLGHNLYLLGGILEVGDREVTLDDMWLFDLRKREQWECLWPGTMHKQIWRGAIHDDDDSYISTGKEDGDDSDDDEDDDEDDNYDENETGLADNDGDHNQKGKKSKSKKFGIREEVAMLNEKYGLGDENCTPTADEALADFYSRTAEYWNQQAATAVDGTGEELSNKEIKREGFKLARERYEELAPVLQRLSEIESERSNNKNKHHDSKANKKNKKTSKKKSSKD